MNHIVNQVTSCDGFKTPREFRRTLASKPCLFKDAIKHSPVMAWGIEKISSDYSQTAFPVQLYEKIATGAGYHGVQTERKEIRVQEYVDKIQTGADVGYASQLPLLEYFPELLRVLQPPRYFSTSLLTQANIWIGPAGTNSNLHCDPDHNLFFQVEGRKRVRLISPKDSKPLKPVRNTFHDMYSPVDLTDSAQLEELARVVKVYETVVEPGDVLYIPAFWWHNIDSLAPSVSLNFWWITPPMLLEQLWKETLYLVKTPPGKRVIEPGNSYRSIIPNNIKHRVWKYL